MLHGRWLRLKVLVFGVAARRDPATGSWVDDDVVQIHYRLSGSSTPWIYGNVR